MSFMNLMVIHIDVSKVDDTDLLFAAYAFSTTPVQPDLGI